MQINRDGYVGPYSCISEDASIHNTDAFLARLSRESCELAWVNSVHDFSFVVAMYRRHGREAPDHYPRPPSPLHKGLEALVDWAEGEVDGYGPGTAKAVKEQLESLLGDITNVPLKHQPAWRRFMGWSSDQRMGYCLAVLGES